MVGDGVALPGSGEVEGEGTGDGESSSTSGFFGSWSGEDVMEGGGDEDASELDEDVRVGVETDRTNWLPFSRALVSSSSFPSPSSFSPLGLSDSSEILLLKLLIERMGRNRFVGVLFPLLSDPECDRDSFGGGVPGG